MALTLLIFTDIYGVTPHWLSLMSSFVSKNITIQLISPYTEQHPVNDLNDIPLYTFEHEQAAYDFFLSQGGHEHYKNICQQALAGESPTVAKQEHPIVTIGFSAGASAAWRALSNENSRVKNGRQCDHFIGFYPSYIRYFTHLTPSCPTTFIFPTSETHFDVQQVSATLANIANVVCVKTPYQHGFLNPLSNHYLHNEYKRLTEAFKDAELLLTPIALRSMFDHTLTSQGQS